MSDRPSHFLELVAELRRRRVFRVALLYAALSWGAIEVADTVFPRLGLPEWTVTLIVVLAILGFPLAVGLAWAFDVDAGRVRRAGAAPSEPGTRRGRQVGWLAGALAIAMLLLLVRFWPTTSEVTADDNSVAVLPFDVAGAEPELAYLGIGLMELVATGLRDSALVALPPDAVGVAMRRSGYDDRAAPPSTDAAVEIARRAGARFALRGRVVGGRSGVVVNVDLIDVESPDEPVHFSTSQPPDDLHGLGEDVIVQAMAARGGLPAHELAAVTTTSPVALKHYLRGVERHRSGDYASALRQYAQALVEDSTFAQAAMGYMALRGNTWVRVPQFEAGRIAWSHRGRLAAHDRHFLEAADNPDITRWEDQIARVEDALRIAEHDARLWRQLGWNYAIVGRSIGIEDAETRGVRAYERAYQLDPRTPAAADWLFSLAVRHRDQTAARRWRDVVLAFDSTSRPTAASIRWTMAVLAGDSTAVRAVGYDQDPSNVIDLVWRTKAHQAHAAEAADELERALRHATGSERGLLAYNVALQAMAEGRPSKLWPALEQTDFVSAPALERLRLWFAHFWQSDTELTADMIEAVERQARAPATAPINRVAAACALSQYHADVGDADRALAAVEPLRDTTGIATVWRVGADLCIEATEAWAAHIRGVPDAAHRLARVDEEAARVAAYDFRLQWGVISPTQVVSARIWEERGDLARARELHRRIVLQRWPDLWVDRLAEEGRLSEMLGDTAAAVHAYDRYLAVRTRPEPPFDAVNERVITRLAALRDQSR